MRKMLIMAILLMATAASAPAAQYLLEFDNPSDCWVEAAIYIQKRSQPEQVVLLAPGSASKVDLVSPKIRPKIKNKDLKFQAGEIVGFTQKVKWPAVSVKVVASYYEDSTKTKYRGQQVETAKAKAGTERKTFNEQRKVVKEKATGSRPAKIKLAKKPPKKAKTMREVAVVNETAASALVAEVEKQVVKKGKKERTKVSYREGKPLSIPKHQQLAIRVSEQTNYLKVDGAVQLNHGGWHQAAILLPLPPEVNRLVISQSQLRQTLIRQGAILNNSSCWIKAEGDFNGVIVPHQAMAVQQLAGERARVHFSYYQDKELKQLVKRTDDYLVWPQKDKYTYWGQQVYFHIDLR